ncbi:GntR family transcriptional regulator [Nocardia transvalensis]|uniref:GntR family transcriptional regulator n=1 Tax=Nocardia transvalensis TaxID=37333 RepID=UPI0018954D45|nr:GntR family transcriptional regulator [Nocardia transvalensis]MBF6334244.1 GntR family transcriptional regulator [Nocardia transvalensis]
MPEPAYVSIAGEYARQIRSGELRPGTQLRSYAELAAQHGVSQIVIRKAVELLLSQGLVRTVERRGTFVADRPNLVRVSPERQMESPEMTYTRETDSEITIDRDTQRVPASDELAEIFGISPGTEITHVITLAAEGGRPISISDTYQPLDVHGTSDATLLEETLTDKIPPLSHAEWLGTPPGDLVKAVHQRFLTDDDRVIMVSDVSYPRDRYEAFVFRMRLEYDTDNGTSDN